MVITILLLVSGIVISLLCYGSWTLGTFHGYERGMDEAIEILETLAANRERREAGQ